MRCGKGLSPAEAIATLRHGQNAEIPQSNLEEGDHKNPHAQVKQPKCHYWYKQSPTILKAIINTPLATTKEIQKAPKELKIMNAINKYDLKPNTLAHITDAKNSKRPGHPHTKPTTQPINTVGIEPTVVAGRKPTITPTRTDNTTPLPPEKRYK